MLPAFRIQL